MSSVESINSFKTFESNDSAMTKMTNYPNNETNLNNKQNDKNETTVSIEQSKTYNQNEGENNDKSLEIDVKDSQSTLTQNTEPVKQENNINTTNHHGSESTQTHVNPIPSAYWRFVPSYFPGPPHAYHVSQQHPAPIIELDTNGSTANMPWQGEHVPYIAPYVNTGDIAYADYNQAYNPAAGYNYTNGYSNVNLVDYANVQWSATGNPTNLTYSTYETTNPSTTSPNNSHSKHTPAAPVVAATVAPNAAYLNYEDYYSKDKLRSNCVGVSPSGNLAYRYIPGDPLILNNHAVIAQHITDNLYPSNSFYQINSYRKPNFNKTNANSKTTTYSKTNGSSSNKNNENETNQVKPNDAETKIGEVESSNVNGVGAETNTSSNVTKKRYSDIVTGKKSNSTTSSPNKQVTAQTDQTESQPNKTEETNSVNQLSYKEKLNYDYSSYNAGNVYSSYNPYKHYNPNGYKSQYFNKTYSDHNNNGLENEMANLSLGPRFYYKGYYNPYENKKLLGFNKNAAAAAAAAFNASPNNLNANQFYYYNNNNYYTGNNNYNKNRDKYDPKEFFVSGEKENLQTSKFFVIKSYSKDDVIRSIKYSIWCSTEEGNRRLDKAFNETQDLKNASVYLFFSVNGSGQFCGIAQMMSRVDYDSKSEIWSQDKWQGTFEVKWIFVKDVPNIKLRHISLENNENKPVTNSRDTQEVFYQEAMQVIDVFRQHIRKTSILDEFDTDEILNQAVLDQIVLNKKA